MRTITYRAAVLLGLSGLNCREPAPNQPAQFVPPTIVSTSASPLIAGRAMLVARVNPNGLETRVRFEYGMSAAYGAFSSPQFIAPAHAAVTVVDTFRNLESGTAYHFRVVADNAVGTMHGPDSVYACVTEFNYPLRVGNTWTYRSWSTFGDPLGSTDAMGTETMTIVAVTTYRQDQTYFIRDIRDRTVNSYRGADLMSSVQVIDTVFTSIIRGESEFVVSFAGTIPRYNTPPDGVIELGWPTSYPYAAYSRFVSDTGVTTHEKRSYGHTHWSNRLDLIAFSQ